MKVDTVPRHTAELYPIHPAMASVFSFLASWRFYPFLFSRCITRLPSCMGMLGGLALLWIVSEFMHPDLDDSEKKKYTVADAVKRIDVPSVLFFFGILLAVGALEPTQILNHFASFLSETIGDNRIIITLIGFLSAVVDNVPLVAASMGMYISQALQRTCYCNLC